MRGIRKDLLLRIYLFASGGIGAITMPILIVKTITKQNRKCNYTSMPEDVIELAISTIAAIPIGFFLWHF